jgi:hypothetical protein
VSKYNVYCLTQPTISHHRFICRYRHAPRGTNGPEPRPYPKRSQCLLLCFLKCNKDGLYREAIQTMGIPMFASGVSSVVTMTPLFATKTVILKRFAAVIAVTMSVGLLYTFVFLLPLMGILGPTKGHTSASGKGGFWRRVGMTLYLSKAVRFIVMCVILAATLVRFPLLFWSYHKCVAPLPISAHQTHVSCSSLAPRRATHVHQAREASGGAWK